ncbi:MAG TPA: ankyrin repeat domain-containing protein [Longimicrobium sp.]|jgi:ankyrin repeat protein|uniref:ankyrin repeat domain-containing protein n=1 Tax=Longimicrobium sp. TaxID=2029185 RepID=UPI002ED926A5
MSFAQLAEAVKAGDADALRTLLQGDGHAAHARGENGESPLLMALYTGRRDLAEVLVAHGREPDGFEATALGDLDRVQALLNEDEGLLTRYTHDGWTVLHYAGFFGHLPLLRLLLERGADPHAISRNGMSNTPLHAALAGPLPLEGVRLLLDAGADPNARQHGGFVALHSAAQRGAIDLIDVLLDADADVNAATDDGRTAIDFAEEKGHAAAMEHLRSRGADEPSATPGD